MNEPAKTQHHNLLREQQSILMARHQAEATRARLLAELKAVDGQLEVWEGRLAHLAGVMEGIALGMNVAAEVNAAREREQQQGQP